MIVRKLRLQRGWSQHTLAELTGVSVRTIQRLEQGHKPGLETAKSLAAVFEVDLSTFISEETSMNETVKIEQEEKEAIAYAKSVKEFVEGVVAFIIILLVFIPFMGFEKPLAYLVFLGVGIGLVIQGLFVFEIVRFPLAKWEKWLIERKLGRKL